MTMVPYDPAITRALKWMQNQAPRITSIIDAKQLWYDRYNTQFWESWETTVFDLRTANPFGLVVWCIILGLPLDIFDFTPITNAFAYGPERGNYIDSGGNVAPMVFTDGPVIYDAGVVVPSGDYSLDLDAGDITFVTAPAAGRALTWSGSVLNEKGTETIVVQSRRFGTGDGTTRVFFLTQPNGADYNEVGFNFQGGGNESVAILSEVRYACQLRYAALVSNGRQEWINFMLRYIFNLGEDWDFPGKRYFYLTDGTENFPAVLVPGTVANFQQAGTFGFYCRFTPVPGVGEILAGDLVSFSNLSGGDATTMAWLEANSPFVMALPLTDAYHTLHPVMDPTGFTFVGTGIVGDAVITRYGVGAIPAMKMEYHIGANMKLSAQFVNLLNNEAYGITPQCAGVSYNVIQDT